MPDWFYRTVSQPILFKLPAITARNLALGMMGRLARLPGGSFVIDFLGHMRADPRLRRTHLGIEFPTAVGLGPHLDADAMALPALARFGFGFLEIGPVSLIGRDEGPPKRLIEEEAIVLPEPPKSLGLSTVLPRIIEASRLGLPLMVRLAEGDSKLIAELAPHVQMFSLATLSLANWSLEDWQAHVRGVVESAAPRPVVLCVHADADLAQIDPLIDAALGAGIRGLLVDGSVRSSSVPEALAREAATLANASGSDGPRLIGLPARDPALERVRHLRHRHGVGLFLIASGGIHEPADALAMREAGADLVQVDSGLVYTGPGLPKRINEALLFADNRPLTGLGSSDRPAEMSWLWCALMGGGMLFGSLLAIAFAGTVVVLPYDEAFVGMSRQQLAEINPRLLPFMAHDRVSLAGTMIAIGVMYLGLSLFGIRAGLHWAQLTVYVSAFTGFASFFGFLGFGYLDPFHAFVTVALLQLLLLGVHSRLGTYTPTIAPTLRTDAAWRRAQWGQLLLVGHGFGLLGAGLVISSIGATHVFVHEDLAFMQTTAEALRSANPRIVPLVAHDRATMGGMLLSSGWVFLLPALWGFRNGSAWLWWTMLLAGLPAYVAAIGVHYAVGYTDMFHLLPAMMGCVVFGVGLVLSYSHLCAATSPER